ncbi:MAG: XdhC family protein [Actinomycetota bacterium]|nr:XdhC family protein [Actinomycetota bacterium]
MALEAARAAEEILALEADEDPLLARIVDMRGFGGRTTGDIAGLGRSRNVGSLMFGSLQPALAELAARLRSSSAAGLEDSVELGDSEAVKAGLACGGSARVAILRLDPLVKAALGEISRRRVVAMATMLSPSIAMLGYRLPGGPLIRGNVSLSEEALAYLDEELGRMLRTRRAESRLVEHSGHLFHLEVFSPPSHIVVVGSSELSAAIVAQFALLGLRASVCDTLEEADRQIQGFGSNDGLVLLSHDHSIGVPLIMALADVPGIYLGALGSRHTQETRRELLEQAGATPGLIDQIHGPVGLDLGSRTPAETAVAIAAEFLAHRSGRDPVPLRGTRGAING